MLIHRLAKPETKTLDMLVFLSPSPSLVVKVAVAYAREPSFLAEPLHDGTTTSPKDPLPRLGTAHIEALRLGKEEIRARPEKRIIGPLKRRI